MLKANSISHLLRYVNQGVDPPFVHGQIAREITLGDGDLITGTIYSVNTEPEVLATYQEQEVEALVGNTSKLLSDGEGFISRQKVGDTLVTIFWDITKAYHVVIFNDQTELGSSGRNRGIPVGAIGWISGSEISGEFEVRIVQPTCTSNCVTYADGGEDFHPNPSHFIPLTLNEKFCLEDFMMHYPALTGAERWEAARLIKKTFRHRVPVKVEDFDGKVVELFVQAGLGKIKPNPCNSEGNLLALSALNSEEP